MAAWTLALLLATPGLDADLRGAVERARVNASGLSMLIGVAGADEPLYRLAPDEARTPASNQKILVATAALQKLGRDFRFRTVIAKHGDDLYVVGDGDPNFSGRFFDGDPTTILRRLAADVKKQGVAKVATLVIDASRFDKEYVHPDWPKDQLARWYCAPVAGLVYNDSCWDVTVGPDMRGGVGRPALVTIEPRLVPIPVANRCTTVGPGAKALIHVGRSGDDALEVRGKTNYTLTAHVAVRQPVRFFGRAFMAALVAEGVPVGRLAYGKLPAEGVTDVVVYRSTLKRTLPVLLTNSQNFYAECLFKRIGDGTFAGGGKAVIEALNQLGIATAHLEPKDGSGLARTNKLTARTLYQCLQHYRDEPFFVEALAAGGTGTLRRRYRALGDRVRAKTGTIRGVTALSGYVTGNSGKRYVFVILANGRSRQNSRRLQDLVVGALSRG